MEKAHSRINWENYPSVATPLNEKNLNKMDQALDEVDNRVLGLDTAKLDKSTANSLVKDVNFDEATGVHTVTLLDGTEKKTNTGYADIVKDVEENTAKINVLGIKNTATGESIHITDSSDSKIVTFALYGKAEQKQYSGKNYSDLSKVVSASSKAIIEKNDNSMRIYNTVEGTYVTSREDVDSSQFSVGKMYTVSADVTYTKGQGRLTLRDSSNSSILAGTSYITASGKYSFTFEYTGVECYLSLFATGGTSELGDVTYSNVQLEEGEVSTPYEPYVGGTASPNPYYPQDVEVAGASGSVEGKSVGKNWLNNLLTSQTSNGVEFTVNNKDKTITLNGTSTAGISLVLYNNPMVLPKGEYKLTIGYGDKGLSDGYPLLTSTTTYKDGREKSDHLNSTQGVVAIGDDIESVRRFRIYIQSGMTFNNLKIYPMLLKAEDNDEYEPYKETTALINTPDGLCGINGVCDEVVKYADGTGKMVQKFKHVVYDGVNVSFSNKSGSTANNIFYTNGLTSDSKRVETANTIANIMSSHFKASNTNDGYYNNSVCVYCNPSYSLIYFGFGLDSRFDTLDKVNAWLTENPVDLWYELATPIETDLTAEEIAEIEKLHTFYPVTNISNDAGCGMSFTYLCDAKNYIDNKFALIERAMVNNI